MDFPVKNCFFALRSYLIEFLTESIEGFKWSKAKEIFSSKNGPIAVEKFH